MPSCKSRGGKRKYEDVKDAVPEALQMARDARGQCPTCGIQCVYVREESRSGITKRGILLLGRCLICHPLPRKTAPSAELVPDIPESILAGGSIGATKASEGSETAAVVKHTARISREQVLGSNVTASQESRMPASIESEQSSTEQRPVRNQGSLPIISQQAEGEPGNVINSTSNSQEMHNPTSPTETGNVRIKIEDESDLQNTNMTEQPSERARADALLGGNLPPTSNEPRLTVYIKDNDGDMFVGKLTEGTMEKGKGEFRHLRSEGEYKGKSDVYKGEVRRGYFDGKGTFHCANGDVYEGELKMGQYSGYGKEKCANGDVYEGDWENDNLVKGKGECNYLDGGRYVGDFQGGKRHGKGKMVFPNNDTYEGEWKEDKREGFGKTIYCIEKLIYTGEYNNDIEEGRGIVQRKSGDIYEGEFKNGKEDGKGTMKFQNGNVYEGDFKEGKEHGIGTMTFKNGKTYEGEYKHGKMDGIGTFEFPNNGGRYIGGWRNDKSNGFGIAVDQDGDIYSGQWKDNKKHGEGELRYKKSGNVKSGTWRKGNLVKKSKLVGTPAESKP